MNSTEKKDIEDFTKEFKFSNTIRNKTFLVTGATGLIGSTLVKCINATNCNARIICPVRNKKKAFDIFNDISVKEVEVVECGNLVEYIHSINFAVDYIIHCASPTNGKFMQDYPVETIELAIDSTKELLHYMKKHKEAKMVYISSLEYYGQCNSDQEITEDYQGYIPMSSTRSSYPIGKLIAEYMCYAYAKEYDIQVKIARLTQTFGSHITSTDNRVFAQFARSIINGNDIVLHTTGESAKPYCFVTDAISAILYILLNGEKGEAYNVANKDTYISIKGLAEYLCKTFNPKCTVVIEERQNMGYAPITKLYLSTRKIEALGWRPMIGMKDMFEKLIKGIIENGK